MSLALCHSNHQPPCRQQAFFDISPLFSLLFHTTAMAHGQNLCTKEKVKDFVVNPTTTIKHSKQIYSALLLDLLQILSWYSSNHMHFLAQQYENLLDEVTPLLIIYQVLSFWNSKLNCFFPGMFFPYLPSIIPHSVVSKMF